MPSNITCSCTSSSSNTSSPPFVSVGGVNCIEHQVSKMDTLAGVAIKYGVEVVDIKRMNGLATDLQMFALNSLHIPLLRRHPPSPTFSNASAPPPPREKSIGRTPPSRRRSYAFESFHSQKIKSPQQKVSPAMSTLQNYYGLKSPNAKESSEGTEMTVYDASKSDHCDEGLLYNGSPLNRLHKSGLVANGNVLDNSRALKGVPITEVNDEEGKRSNDKYVWRRQNAEPDSGSGTPEKVLKEENGGGSSSSSSFSPITGKGLALRPKTVSRYSLVPDAESGWLSFTHLGTGDPLMANGLAGVHKSSSTSSLQDQDSNNSSFVWLTSKWSLKPDLQALSSASIARPIFDGVPKPITARRNKAALD